MITLPLHISRIIGKLTIVRYFRATNLEKHLVNLIKISKLLMEESTNYEMTNYSVILYFMIIVLISLFTAMVYRRRDDSAANRARSIVCDYNVDVIQYA